MSRRPSRCRGTPPRLRSRTRALCRCLRDDTCTHMSEERIKPRGETAESARHTCLIVHAIKQAIGARLVGNVLRLEAAPMMDRPDARQLEAVGIHPRVVVGALARRAVRLAADLARVRAIGVRDRADREGAVAVAHAPVRSVSSGLVVPAGSRTEGVSGVAVLLCLLCRLAGLLLRTRRTPTRR